MILRYLSICLLMVFATACVSGTAETSGTQSTSGTEASQAELETEDDHSAEDDDHDDHGDDDHSEENDGERRELGAHEHGAAELMIAWSSSDVAIDLETPSYNILGFEYAPSSDEEKALLAESMAALESGELLMLSPDAGCTVISVDIQTSFEEKDHNEDEEGHNEDEEGHNEDEEGHNEDEEGHNEDEEGLNEDEEGLNEDEEGLNEDEEGHNEDEEGHNEDDHDEEIHSDIDVSYNLECEQPENIASLDASQLFAQFPNFEDIQVQWISDTEQSAADLTPDNPVLELK